MEHEYDPTMGYLSFSHYVPVKGGYNIDAIKRALTFQNFQGYEMCRTRSGAWIKIPRHFFDWNGVDIDSLPFITYDISPTEPSVESDYKIKTSFSLYPNQRKVFKSMFEKKAKDQMGDPLSGIISMPCGSGKTVVAIHAMAAVPSPIRAVVVPTIDLAHQWKERFLEHTNLMENDISIIRGGTQKWYWQKPVLIFTIHALAGAVKLREKNPNIFPSELLENCRVWVYDECHRLGAGLFAHAGSAGYGVRWGLTATPYRSDGLEFLFHAHLGPTLYEMGDERKAQIIFCSTAVSITMEERQTVLDSQGSVNWPKLVSWLVSNSERRGWLLNHINYIKDSREKILILSPRITEIKYLCSQIKDAGMLIGNMQGHERQESMKKHIIVASTQLAKEGLDIKGLNTIICTAPFVDEGVFQQVVGRAFRGDDPQVFIPKDNIPEILRSCKTMKQIAKQRGHECHDW